MAPGLSQLYQRLPTELQLKIWDHTLEPRCIKVFYEVSDDRLPQDDQDGTPPLALQVCRTLRAHFLPRYPEFFQGGCNSKLKVRPHVRINSALDTVLVYSVWSSALIYMSTGTSSQDIARFRHIAVSSVLWQTAVLSYGYPEWRKAMSKLTSLESITLVTDQRLPTDGTESPLTQAVEKTLQLVHSENQNWVIPKVRIISTDIVCHGEVDSYYSLDEVDFGRGDVKEASIAALTSPNSCGRSWIPTLRQLGGNRRTQRTYVPKPSLFSMWPNTLGVQAQRGSGWGLEDSAIVVPSALAALSLASFFLAC